MATFTAEPNQIIRELQVFLAGSTHSGKVRRAEVTNSALFLLKHLPVAKEAVLEFMNSLFDEAVNNRILKIELEDNATVASNVASDEHFLSEVYSMLFSFVKDNPGAWAPIICKWTLGLLGYLSSKYADRRVVPHPGNFPEVLQLWMSCHPTRTLMNLTTQSLSILIESDPDVCIDSLLEISVQHSPHFDWVVAHIGSCFPQTIISRVIACGLKDFCMHQDAQQKGNLSSEKNVPRLTSVVGILGHLAGTYGTEIQKALFELFQESFVDNPTKEQVLTVPFLLQLASLSDVLLRITTSEFVTILTPTVLNNLAKQARHWNKAAVFSSSSMLHLVLHLLLRSAEGGCQVVQSLLDIITPSKNQIPIDEKVQEATGRILDALLLDIQQLVHSGSVDIPILDSLKSHIPELCECLIEEKSTRTGWVLNLLKFLCLHGEETTSSKILGQLLQALKGEKHFSFLKTLLFHVEPHQPSILPKTVSWQLQEMKAGSLAYPLRLVKNLISLMKSKEYSPKIIETLRENIETLVTQPSLTMMEYYDAIIELLSLTAAPEEMSVSAVNKIASACVYYFFAVTGQKDLDKRKLILKRVNVCQKLLKILCQQSACQHIAIRMLLEGVLSERHCRNFGSSLVTPKSANQSNYTKEKSLLVEIGKHATDITLPQSHSSVFHAGVIGNGLRALERIELLPDSEILLNKQLFLQLIHSCCSPYKLDSTEKSVKSYKQGGMKIVALLTVELVSPDIMFNGLPWPDEDTQKVTIERDLNIKQMFCTHPVLWNLLYAIASIHPSLCYCSVLLRAIVAVVMTHWGSCQAKLASHLPEQLELTKKVIELLSLGQLLPPPLAYVGDILPHLPPFELSCVLADIWQYMHDNVPSPALFTGRDSSSGQMWRDFSREAGPETAAPKCDKKYTDRLRIIMQKNIEKFGSLYVTFFEGF
ncbi:integrator complex subunit 5-like [Limulus polyphemus]|uniref:Integrator complex subunit 5-like n=1 Tax=Limulus polyphemus TaxID=6850 RepID=A0ABM1B795_LIMPO|nr:integrator complex subunit 5-like [Limulus polyphemus]